MKELSIEEKAKRYDEILTRAEGANLPYYTEDIMSKVKEFVDYLLPELKKSEDERIRKGLIEYFLHYPDHEITYYDLKADFVISWLEKQGENNMGISEAAKKELEDSLNKALEKETPESWNEFLDEQKSLWSEEDEKTIIQIKKALEDFFSASETDKIKYWLESLKDRVLLQPKKEWSEEDERIKDNCIEYVKAACLDRDESNECVDWLKSIRPQNRWSPSDEQMTQLKRYCPDNRPLTSLYEQLKKLKEE